MAEEKHPKPGTGQGQARATQKDKVARPEPNLDPAEGDEETIDESLRQKEGKEQ